MTKKDFLLEIHGNVQTNLMHDEWWGQFIMWLESRGEYFGLCPEDVSRKKSIFTEEFQKIIKETVEKAKYVPNEDPVLIEHKKKIRKILGQSYL